MCKRYSGFRITINLAKVIQGAKIDLLRKVIIVKIAG